MYSSNKPSARGELEITDINNKYLQLNQLSVLKMNRGFAWLDAGTHDSLYQATQFIEVVENRRVSKLVALKKLPIIKITSL